MDVEKTIQSIAASQLRAERRADQFDKQLRVTANLVREGIKLVRDLRESQRESSESQRELRDSQKETDFKFNALMDAHIRTEETVRGHDLWLRKHDEAMRKHDEAMRKSDEKFNRLLEELRRRNGNGRH